MAAMFAAMGQFVESGLEIAGTKPVAPRPRGGRAVELRSREQEIPHRRCEKPSPSRRDKRLRFATEDSGRKNGLGQSEPIELIEKVSSGSWAESPGLSSGRCLADFCAVKGPPAEGPATDGPAGLWRVQALLVAASKSVRIRTPRIAWSPFRPALNTRYCQSLWLLIGGAAARALTIPILRKVTNLRESPIMLRSNAGSDSRRGESGIVPGSWARLRV